MYCVPEKQVRLLEMIMEFHERAANCIKLGAPLVIITALTIREGLSRLKSIVKNTELSQLDEATAEMRSEFGDIEKTYRAKER
jgi:V/A-type H+-transporting ATPase subunit A